MDEGGSARRRRWKRGSASVGRLRLGAVVRLGWTVVRRRWSLVGLGRAVERWRWSLEQQLGSLERQQRPLEHGRLQHELPARRADELRWRPLVESLGPLEWWWRSLVGLGRSLVRRRDALVVGLGWWPLVGHESLGNAWHVSVVRLRRADGILVRQGAVSIGRGIFPDRYL